MAGQAGETVRETGDFRCSKCQNQVHVTPGDTRSLIPEAMIDPCKHGRHTPDQNMPSRRCKPLTRV